MPSYDYECKQCNGCREEHHKALETPNIICAACNTKMEKVFNVAPLMRMGVGHAWNGSQSEVNKMKKKKSCVRKNKCRLHVSVNSLLKANACKDGLEIFKNGHPVTKQNNDELIPLSECFKSNSIQDVIWALRATVEDSRSIAKEFAKRCAARAARAARAAGDAARAADAAREAAYAADAYDARAAREAAYADCASRAAAYAARAAGDAAYADAYADCASRAAAYAAGDAAYAEREKQKEDLLELLRS